MYQDIIKNIVPELDKVVEFFTNEVAKIRTGRASISLFEDIEVECFGQKFPLKQLASLSTPEPRQVVIQPWDASYLESIEKALSAAHLGASPVVAKDVIRVTMPPVSEEYRKNLLHVLSQKKEEARSTIRRWREEAWREVQDKTREGEIREDDKFRAKDELQEKVDEYQKKLDDIAERKEKELTE